MGNICLIDDETRHKEFTHKKFQCMKCGDKFTLKKNSTRFHCRNHRFDIYGFCIDCRAHREKCNSCCFHVKKNRFFF